MIALQNIHKSYNSDIVLDNISLNVENGKITTLVGANGAGKTTLIRIIAGLIQPDGGRVINDDHDTIGVLLGGDVDLYNNFSGYENLKFFAELKGVKKTKFEKRCRELSDVLEFEEFLHKKISVYSRGMKQKIAFAIALIHNPDIILLDEPSTGLDIPTSNEVLNFIKYCKNAGKAILISTHNITEIADLSDTMIILENKRIRYCGDTKAFFDNCLPEHRIERLAKELRGDII